MAYRLHTVVGHLIAPSPTASVGVGEHLSPYGTTKGAPPPIAANGGLPWKIFEKDGDVGSLAARDWALKHLAEGIGAKVAAAYTSAPPGPIHTKWGVGFRQYSECLEHIRARNEPIPAGGVALPLRYTAYEEPTCEIVPSNRFWKDPACEDFRAMYTQEMATSISESSDFNKRHLYFPAMLLDARRIAEYHPGFSPYTSACMDKFGLALVDHWTKCKNIFDPHELEAVFYPEVEKILLDFFPGATDALVYNHDAFNKDARRSENQENKDPGVNAYVDLVHNDLNDNSGQVRCKELLTQNLRNFGRQIDPPLTEAEAEAKMSRRFMSINLAMPADTVEQNPFVLCAWPSFADQPYITNYRIYDDRVGETTLFTYRPNHEWYWIPHQKPTEISMLKCYDSQSDGSMSRWSFHTSCIDHTAPASARCRKSVVLRSFVFF